MRLLHCPGDRPAAPGSTDGNTPALGTKRRPNASAFHRSGRFQTQKDQRAASPPRGRSGTRGSALSPPPPGAGTRRTLQRGAGAAPGVPPAAAAAAHREVRVGSRRARRGGVRRRAAALAGVGRGPVEVGEVDGAVEGAAVAAIGRRVPAALHDHGGAAGGAAAGGGGRRSGHGHGQGWAGGAAALGARGRGRAYTGSAPSGGAAPGGVALPVRAGEEPPAGGGSPAVRAAASAREIPSGNRGQECRLTPCRPNLPLWASQNNRVS